MESDEELVIIASLLAEEDEEERRRNKRKHKMWIHNIFKKKVTIWRISYTVY